MALEKKFDATTAEPRLYQAWEAAGCLWQAQTPSQRPADIAS